MEFLVVQGQGSYERLKVGGKAPGPGGFLRFKMTESLLKDCTDSEWSRIQFVIDVLHPQTGNHLLIGGLNSENSLAEPF